MNAADILAAIRKAHPGAAVVHEVVIHDHLWDERRAESRPVRRIDALMFASLQRTAIEIKTSLADWRRDTYQKRAPWEAVTHRFVYAVPEALLDSIGNDFYAAGVDPFGCGIWTVSESGKLSVARKAKVRPHPEPLPQQVVQSLAYRAARTLPQESSEGGDR